MPGEQTDALAPLMVFYSYAHEDERLRRKLEKHLSLLRQQGVITEWHDRQILPGTDWAHVIDTHLMTAQLILLLISPDFLASDYCYGVEMQRALERHAEGSTWVIPILLRPVDWESAPFAFLQCLPRDGRPITQWNNQDEALVTVAKGIRAVIEQIHPPMTLPPSPAPLAPHAPTRLKYQAQPFSASQDRNRQRMLERVRTTWITGVLDHSLHDAARIALGLREEPGALANPWRLVVQEVDHPAQLLPAGTRITEVYDEADGALLILGEPGAGKTTLLLELARDLLNHAQANESEPIPVVFNLSSWAEKQPPLTDWLVEELNIRYQVPRVLAQTWIDNDQLLLLLDGLDEVAAIQRSECIKAINSYRQAHALVSVVVCSRSADYLNQTQQLSLHRAVIVQPLTAQEIDEYLVCAGEQVAALRGALGHDPVLQELATTPLMLTILTLVYQDVPHTEIVEGGSTEARQQQLFASYVQHMLKRRGVETRYKQGQTIRWLAQLARQMSQQNQTVFYIERMQPNWLSDSRSHQLYRKIVRLFVGLVTGLVGGLFNGLVTGLILIPLYDMAFGGLIVVWLLLFIGLICGLYLGLTFGRLNGQTNKRFSWMTMSSGIGGFCGELCAMEVTAIQPTEVVGWSWVSMWQGWSKVEVLKIGRRCGLYLLMGLVFGLLSWWEGGLLVGSAVGLTLGLTTGLAFGGIGLTLGLVSMLDHGLQSGLSSKVLDEHNLLIPNQGMRGSARNSLRIGLIFGLPSGLVYGVSFGLLSWLSSPPINPLLFGLVSGLVGGLLYGLISGLVYGGVACIQHIVLRLLLWRTGSIPWNYPHFLDYTTGRILLRKVGGGYMFIHRLLLDYFAALEMAPAIEELTAHVRPV